MQKPRNKCRDFTWLRVQVTDSITGVDWDKWDTAGVVSKVSHLGRLKGACYAKNITPKPNKNRMNSRMRRLNASPSLWTCLSK